MSFPLGGKGGGRAGHGGRLNLLLPLAPLQDPRPACIPVAVPTIPEYQESTGKGTAELVPHRPATPAAAGAEARQMLGCPLSGPRAMNIFSPMHTPRWGDSDVTSMSGLHQTTLWLLKPGRPSPPRGTTLQPGVLCKAPSPCHRAEPMATSQGCLRG